MQNSSEKESDKGTQAQHLLAETKQAIAVQKIASQQIPAAASYIPAHLPAKPCCPQLTLAQVNQHTSCHPAHRLRLLFLLLIN